MTETITFTTDCPTCGRTAKECNDSHAKGWDGCCQKCDERGRVVNHRAHGKRPDPGRPGLS